MTIKTTGFNAKNSIGIGIGVSWPQKDFKKYANIWFGFAIDLHLLCWIVTIVFEKKNSK